MMQNYMHLSEISFEIKHLVHLPNERPPDMLLNTQEQLKKNMFQKENNKPNPLHESN